MIKMDISIRDLQYFVALAKTLHFGKAAEECNVSQPTLSGQIAKLEAHLDTKLFERNAKKVILSDKAKLLLPLAQKILVQSSEFIEAAYQKQDPNHSVLRLGVIGTVGPYYIPKFLPALRKQYPHLKIFLEEGLTEHLLAKLKNAELDAVIAAKTFEDDSLNLFPIHFEKFFLGIPKDHKLNQKTEVIVSDLKLEELLLLPEGHCLADQSIDLCTSSQKQEVRRMQATSLETLKHLVASGLGYAVFPEYSINKESRYAGLVEYKEFKNAKIGREIVFVTRQSSLRLAEFRPIISLIKNILS